MLFVPRLASGELDLVRYTKELARGGLEADTGVSSGWVENGAITVTRDPDRFRDLKYVLLRVLLKLTDQSSSE